MRSLAILSPQHPQNDKWSKLFGKTQILPEKLIQEWCWIVNHFVVELSFCILFWDHISSFNETCLFSVTLLFWSQEMFNISFLTIFFYQTPTCQSFKSILITEMTRYLLEWHEVTKQISNPHMKWYHKSCS
jgi:hypothetical protein